MVVNEDNNEPRHCLHKSGYLSLEDIRKKKVKLLQNLNHGSMICIRYDFFIIY